ncbi:hypothetical protein HKX48_005321 [Thoreauomyces humboldtii]|nr:hypothetical protein HKX48_005321 [Thoreauomyces humboldtii]
MTMSDQHEQQHPAAPGADHALLDLIARTVSSSLDPASTPDSLRTIQAILREDRLRKEADLATLREATVQKRLDLDILQQQERLLLRQPHQWDPTCLPPTDHRAFDNVNSVHPAPKEWPSSFQSTLGRFTDPLQTFLDTHPVEDLIPSDDWLSEGDTLSGPSFDAGEPWDATISGIFPPLLSSETSSFHEPQTPDWADATSIVWPLLSPFTDVSDSNLDRGELRQSSEATFDQPISASEGTLKIVAVNQLVSGEEPADTTRPISQPAPRFRVPSSSRTKPRSSLKEKAIENVVSVACNVCSTVFADAILYAPAVTVVGFIADYTCSACTEKQGRSSVNKKTTGKARRTVHPRDADAECDICRKIVGSGGVRAAAAEAAGDEWSVPQFAIELNCKPCLAKYALCRSCGGGGRYRTGKWRPLQLFPANRATCTFPHQRFAAMKTRAHVWRVRRDQYPPYSDLYYDTQEATPAPVWALREAVRECAFSSLGVHTACAKVMEQNEGLSDWNMVTDQINVLSSLADAELCGTAQKARGTQPENMRTYIGMRWVVTDAESDDPAVWDRLTPDNARTRQPRVTSFDIVDWDVSTGLVWDCIGMSSSGNSIAVKCPSPEILARAKADHAQMEAAAAAAAAAAAVDPSYDPRSPPLLLPVPPTWIHGWNASFTSRAKALDGPYKRVEDLDPEAAPWVARLPTSATMRTGQTLVEKGIAAKSQVHFVGNVDEVLASDAAEMERRRDGLAKEKKRAAKG